MMFHYQKQNKWIAKLSLLVYILMLAVNWAAATGKFFDLSTAQVSMQYPSLATPAGFTFSIWGVIYLLLGIELWMAQRESGRSSDARQSRRYRLFIFSCLLNMAWLVSWSARQIPLSFGFIVLLTAVVFLILAENFGERRFSERFLYASMSVYASWLCIALSANLMVLFGFLGVALTPTAEVTVVLGLLALASAVHLYMVVKKRDGWFAFAGAFALGGLAYERFAQGQIMPIGYLSAVMSVTLIVLALLNHTKRKKRY